jgi:hypothetical protein
LIFCVEKDESIFSDRFTFVVENRLAGFFVSFWIHQRLSPGVQACHRHDEFLRAGDHAGAISLVETQVVRRNSTHGRLLLVHFVATQNSKRHQR